MGSLSDVSRWVSVLLGLLAIYLAYGYLEGYDQDWLAVGVFLLGMVAVLFVAVRFSEDY